VEKARHCYQLVTIKAALPLRLFQARNVNGNSRPGGISMSNVLDLFS
jgi:hypothetical protein